MKATPTTTTLCYSLTFKICAKFSKIVNFAATTFKIQLPPISLP